jgi:hypothetical protein
MLTREETMANKLQLPVLAAKLATNVARERLVTARVTSLKDVPPSANALTNEWLTAALCREVPGATVVDFGSKEDRTARVHDARYGLITTSQARTQACQRGCSPRVRRASSRA